MEARAGLEDDRDVRFPPAVARVPEIHDPTFQGPRNCNAAVNRQEVSMPPTHPPASPHTTTTHHKQRKAQIVIVR